MVFVVDDDESMREALGSLFRSVSLKVETFGSAADLLRSKLPDVASCLVLDVRLPGVSGLDFQAELGKANIHIPVIFMTGHGDIPMSVQAMKAGAVDFLTKPFRDQDMLDAVAAAQRRTFTQNRLLRYSSPLVQGGVERTFESFVSRIRPITAMRDKRMMQASLRSACRCSRHQWISATQPVEAKEQHPWLVTPKPAKSQWSAPPLPAHRWKYRALRSAPGRSGAGCGVEPTRPNQSQPSVRRSTAASISSIPRRPTGSAVPRKSSARPLARVICARACSSQPKRDLNGRLGACSATPAAHASCRRPRTRCGACEPNTSMSTRSTGPTPWWRSRKPRKPCASCSSRARSAPSG